MKKITITFDGNSVTTDAEGMKGKNCVKETEKLLAHLKPTLVNRKLKKEYKQEAVGQSVSA